MASSSEQRILWDAYDSGDDDEAQKNDNPIHTGTELVNMNPEKVLLYDSSNEKFIRDLTNALATSLGFCEQIVIAAYNVADYVPAFSNDEQSKFWEQEVIPNLVESLTQDVRARSIIIQSFASIGDLFIIIQNAGEIVKQTKGAPEAIQIARENISGALKTLEKWIKDASNLDNTAIKNFGIQTEKILKIIGPIAANFYNQKCEIEKKLKKHYDEQKKLYTELAEKQEEVSRYGFLISATEKHLYGAKQELMETKRRTDALNQLNAEVEQKIQNILVSTSQTVTTRQNRYRILFWRNYSSTTTKSVMVENPNRVAEQKYCEGIILSRMARIQENQNAEEAKKKVTEYLNECLCEHKSKYMRANTELEEMNKAYDENMKRLQVQIDNLHKEIEEIDKKDIDTQKKLVYKEIL